MLSHHQLQAALSYSEPYYFCLMSWTASWYGARFRQKPTLEDAIGPTPARLKLLQACDQCHSSRVSTPRTGSHYKLRPITEGRTRLLLQ
jgi:hypothetical protein